MEAAEAVVKVVELVGSGIVKGVEFLANSGAGGAVLEGAGNVVGQIGNVGGDVIGHIGKAANSVNVSGDMGWTHSGWNVSAPGFSTGAENSLFSKESHFQAGSFGTSSQTGLFTSKETYSLGGNSVTMHGLGMVPQAALGALSHIAGMGGYSERARKSHRQHFTHESDSWRETVGKQANNISLTHKRTGNFVDQIGYSIEEVDAAVEATYGKSTKNEIMKHLQDIREGRTGNVQDTEIRQALMRVGFPRTPGVELQKVKEHIAANRSELSL